MSVGPTEFWNDCGYKQNKYKTKMPNSSCKQKETTITVTAIHTVTLKQIIIIKNISVEIYSLQLHPIELVFDTYKRFPP